MNNLDLYKDEKNITPEFAVDKWYITGKMSREKKKMILDTYGKLVKERLLNNKSYSIVFENNGSKKRKIYNLVVKRLDIVGRPVLKLAIESNSQREIKVNGSLMDNDLKNIPMSERYKFPKV